MTLPRTQNEQVLDYLKTVGPLTPMDAYSTFGCFRLGARVWELKQQGHRISREIVKVPSGARGARYSLE